MDTKIIHLVEKYLPIKTKEKEELGEVFTPIQMIESLLDEFPKDVWTDSNFTWLDPCVGVGNFPLCIFFRYMKTSKISDLTERAKHIIEKQLYMIEYNPTNVEVCRKIFQELCPKATPNLLQADTLKLCKEAGFSKKDWPTHYDCVIGNPPYNLGGTKREGSKRAHIQFTECALNIAKEKGFVSFICPPNYRETGTPMNKLFQDSKGYFPFIKIYGSDETHKLFKIQGRVDSFIYQKSVHGNTQVDDEYNQRYTIDIDLTRHIPNFSLPIFDKIWKKVKELGSAKAFRTTEMSSIKSHLFSCRGGNKVLHLIIKNGRRVLRSSKQHSLTKVPKLFVNGLGIPYTFYDRRGEYGLSQSPLVVLKPSKSLVNFVSSQFFQFIVWGLRITGNNNLPYLFDYIPDVSKSKFSFDDMGDVARFFELTKSEVDFVLKNFPVPSYTNTDLLEKCASVTRKNRSHGTNHTRKNL